MHSSLIFLNFLKKIDGRVWVTECSGTNMEGLPPKVTIEVWENASPQEKLLLFQEIKSPSWMKDVLEKISLLNVKNPKENGVTAKKERLNHYRSELSLYRELLDSENIPYDENLKLPNFPKTLGKKTIQVHNTPSDEDVSTERVIHDTGHCVKCNGLQAKLNEFEARFQAQLDEQKAWFQAKLDEQESQFKMILYQICPTDVQEANLQDNSDSEESDGEESDGEKSDGEKSN